VSISLHVCLVSLARIFTKDVYCFQIQQSVIVYCVRVIAVRQILLLSSAKGIAGKKLHFVSNDKILKDI